MSVFQVSPTAFYFSVTFFKSHIDKLEGILYRENDLRCISGSFESIVHVAHERTTLFHTANFFSAR